MESNGITPLPNKGLHIRENFYLAGIEDFTRRNPNISYATENALEDDFVLVIAHNPDVSMKQDTSGIDLILSGHTHGGQITFFRSMGTLFYFYKSYYKLWATI